MKTAIALAIMAWATCANAQKLGLDDESTPTAAAPSATTPDPAQKAVQLHVPEAPVRQPPSLVPPLVVGITAVALGITGAALWAQAHDEFGQKCLPNGCPDAWGSIRDREIAGVVLGLTGAAAMVADVGLWVHYGLGGKKELRLSLTGAGVKGAF